MALYALIGRDRPDAAAQRQAHRADHLAKLQVLDAQGRIRYAGPLLNAENQPAGSLIMFEAIDLAAAKEIAAADPYVVHNVFETFEVFETRATLPKVDADR